MKNKLSSAKNFVAKHRVAITFTSTATACMWLNSRGFKQHNDFLKEKGLYDEFYTPEQDI